MDKNQLLHKPLLLVLLLLLSFTCFSQVSKQWVARYNGLANGSDRATAIALDAAGNVYVTGSSMVSATNTDFATIKYNANGSQLWVKTYNGTGNGGDEAKAIAVDNAGNVYVTGQSEGTGFFNFDYATIKYDANGNQIWVKRYDGPGMSTDVVAAIALDGAGNVYITGSSYGSAGNTDYATIKYDNNGNELWVSRFDGLAKGNDGAIKLVVDGGGNVYVTGYSTGLGTDEDFVTIKHNSAGAVLWAATYNGTANALDQAFDLALDPAGYIYVTGQSFEPGGGSAYATIKYNATSGAQQWVARYHPGVGSDVANAIAVDIAGNAYVTGRSNKTNSDFGDDIATIKYNTDGMPQWVARFDGPDHDNDYGTDIAVDAAGNTYVTGLSNNVEEAISDGDYLTLKYNSSGAQQWVARYDGSGHSTDIAAAVALDASGNVYITGFSNGNGTDADYATIKYAQATTGVTGFNLINATTDKSIQQLVSGAVLNLATLPSRRLNIRAVTKPSKVGSVAFNLSGQQTKVRSDESGPHYSLQGDNSGDYFSWTPAVGSYTLTARTYTGANGKGTASAPTTITFTVIDNPNQSTRLSGISTMVEEVIKIYPNPFKDAFTLELPSGLAAERAFVSMTTIEGKTVYQKEVKVNGNLQTIELDRLSKLPSGMYLLRLQLDEKPVVLKVVKQ